MKTVEEEKKIELRNMASRWVNNDTVKIGKCNKCGVYYSQSVSSYMTKFNTYCYQCNAFRTFNVNPKIKFVDDPDNCYGLRA